MKVCDLCEGKEPAVTSVHIEGDDSHFDLCQTHIEMIYSFFSGGDDQGKWIYRRNRKKAVKAA